MTIIGIMTTTMTGPLAPASATASAPSDDVSPQQHQHMRRRKRLLVSSSLTALLVILLIPLLNFLRESVSFRRGGCGGGAISGIGVRRMTATTGAANEHEHAPHRHRHRRTTISTAATAEGGGGGGEHSTSHEPSHVRLCRALLRSTTETDGDHSNSDIDNDRPSDAPTPPTLIVEEDKSVCDNDDAPYSSLMHIFTSALLAQLARRGDRNNDNADGTKRQRVFYEHNCGGEIDGAYTSMSTSSNTKTITTVQQTLPPTLTLPVRTVSDDAALSTYMRASCAACLTGHDAGSGGAFVGDVDVATAFTSCLLNPAGSGGDDRSTSTMMIRPDPHVAFALLPAIRVNLRAAAVEFRERRHSSSTTAADDNGDVTGVGGDGGGRRGLATGWWKNNAYLQILGRGRGQHGATYDDDADAVDGITKHQPEQQQQQQQKRQRRRADGAVIYLDCADERCGTTHGPHGSPPLAAPFYLFAQEIPRSVTNIAILTSSKCCSSRMLDCISHGRALRAFLGRVYPTKPVTLDCHLEEGGGGDGGEDGASSTTVEWRGTGTGEAYMRMILARQVVSPPSLSTVLPVLAKPHYSTLIQRTDLVGTWLDELIEIARLESSNGVEDNGNNPHTDLSGIRYVPEHVVPLLPTTALASTATSVTYPATSTTDSYYHYHDPTTHPWGNGVTPEVENFRRFALHASVPPPERPAQCRRVRGRSGHWIHDPTYAASAQYTGPLLGYAGRADRDFVATEAMPYRLPTTYRWEEDAPFGSCPVDVMTHSNLCDVLVSMDITRVLFVGDSLTFHWSQSFWKLLGEGPTWDSPGDGMEATDGHENLTWDRVLHCPSNLGGGEIEIDVRYVRNDQLNDNVSPVTFGTFNCGENDDGYCHPWVDSYALEHPTRRTLLLVNTGAHTHHEPTFRRDVHDFIDLMERATSSTSAPPRQNREDVVFFRSTVPGHRDCLLDDVRPYRNYTEYAETITQKFDWDRFPMYNEYLDGLLEERDAERRRTKRRRRPEGADERGGLVEGSPVGEAGGGSGSGSGNVRVELLDVFPMTVLRPDGHASSKDCNGCGLRRGKGDCLHYSLPGPMDWWNHLMYSNLRDIAMEEEAETEGGGHR